MGVPEKEIADHLQAEAPADGEAVVDCEAVQDGKQARPPRPRRFLESKGCSLPARRCCSARWWTASRRPGQPVGSKTLAADPDVTAGPSTIRNELAVLEERGLLAHPHTSAGRVPTDAGYRYYVDRAAAGGRRAAPSCGWSSCGARSTRRCG